MPPKLQIFILSANAISLQHFRCDQLINKQASRIGEALQNSRHNINFADYSIQFIQEKSVLSVRNMGERSPTSVPRNPKVRVPIASGLETKRQSGSCGISYYEKIQKLNQFKVLGLHPEYIGSKKGQDG
jgi:hypothetical protein